MVNGSPKRVVVIRDIPSNFIEEAILILKGEPSGVSEKAAKEGCAKKPAQGNEFLIKEAEMIIQNYVKECKNRGLFENEKTLKPKFLKKRTFFNACINIALAAGIALLIFLLARVF